MAIRYGTDLTDDYVTSDTNTLHVIEEGELLRGVIGAAFTFDNADGSSLLIDGEITSTNQTVIDSNPLSDGVRIRVGETGLVSGTAGIYLAGADNSLVNRGRLEASIGPANVRLFAQAVVQMAGEDARVVNHGTITAAPELGASGILIAEGGADDLKSVLNTGKISASTGISVDGADDPLIENRGRISGTYGIDVNAATGRVMIDNDGTIIGNAMAVTTGAGYTALVNTGLVKSLGATGKVLPLANGVAGPISYWGYGTGVDEVANAGRMLGDVRLGSNDDSYFGTRGGTVTGTVFGEAGNDVLVGSGGDDLLDGGDDDDTLNGRGGDDILAGGGGADLLDGGGGNDSLDGGTGDDGLDGGAGRDQLRGGDGDDILHDAGGADRHWGGAGRDVLNGGDGNDRLYGEGDGDVMFGEAGDDLLDGGDGDDEIWGGNDADTLAGGDGHDQLWGGEGDDTLTGDAGDDLLLGDAGSDSLDGGDGRDILDGGAGADTLRGGADDDNIRGGDGNDKLFGQAGEDFLVGDAGNDRLAGGTGADVFAFDNHVLAHGTDRITDFEDGIDRIDLSNFNPGDLATFVANAVTNVNGNAVIDMSFFDQADPALFTGTVVILGAAGLIDASDFVAF